MRIKDVEALALFSVGEDVSFLPRPGLHRAVLGCMGIAAGVVGLAYLLREAIVVDGGAAHFTPWFYVGLVVGIIGIKLFGYVCFFPSDNRTLTQIASNGRWIGGVLIAATALFGVSYLANQALSNQALVDFASTSSRWACAAFVLFGSMSTLKFARVRYGPELTKEQAERVRASAAAYAEYALVALAYFVFRQSV